MARAALRSALWTEVERRLSEVELDVSSVELGKLEVVEDNENEVNLVFVVLFRAVLFRAVLYHYLQMVNVVDTSSSSEDDDDSTSSSSSSSDEVL